MGIFDFLKGGKAPEPSNDPLEPARAATHAALDAAWAAVGQAEADLIAHLISPQLMGGAVWPTTRQAYRVIRREGRVIIATDGLSDVVDMGQGPVNGIGLELFIETPDLPEGFDVPGQPTAVVGSWAFRLLSATAELIAGAGDITGTLDNLGVISTEFPGVRDAEEIRGQVPDGFITADGSLGLLIGGPAPDFTARVPTPVGEVRLVPIVLIPAADLEVIRTGGGAARVALAERLGRPITRLAA